MLVLTKKQYDIEEPIQIKGEDGSLLVDYVMRITPDEKLEIQNLIFDEEDVKNGRLMSKLQKEEKIEELEELEAKVLENSKKREEKFENLVFKDQREIIKEKVGESVYLDLVNMIFDFFVKTFADKKASQINTLTTHLRKITNK